MYLQCIECWPCSKKYSDPIFLVFLHPQLCTALSFLLKARGNFRLAVRMLCSQTAFPSKDILLCIMMLPITLTSSEMAQSRAVWLSQVGALFGMGIKCMKPFSPILGDLSFFRRMEGLCYVIFSIRPVRIISFCSLVIHKTGTTALPQPLRLKSQNMKATFFEVLSICIEQEIDIHPVC